MRILLTTVLCSSLSLLSGCASIVSGTGQSISVITTPVTGASCELSNNKGKWYVPVTPGSVTVHRSYNDLNVICEKPGYKSAQEKFKSSTKGMMAGNIVFGGLVGGGVDAATGAAYDYPQQLVVMMKPVKGKK